MAGKENNRILVVEDDEGDLKNIVDFLNGNDFQVTGKLYDFLENSKADFINELQTLVENDNYLLIITDGLDGLWKDVMKIAIGAGMKALLYSGSDDYIDEAADMGYECLSKPRRRLPVLANVASRLIGRVE